MRKSLFRAVAIVGIFAAPVAEAKAAWKIVQQPEHPIEKRLSGYGHISSVSEPGRFATGERRGWCAVYDARTFKEAEAVCNSILVIVSVEKATPSCPPRCSPGIYRVKCQAFDLHGILLGEQQQDDVRFTAALRLEKVRYDLVARVECHTSKK